MKRTTGSNLITNIPTVKICGVYSLTDGDGGMYIGSSKDIQKRCRKHLTNINSYLREGINGFLNPKMKDAVLRGASFRCDVLAQFNCAMSPVELREVERLFIQKYKDRVCYNCMNIIHKV